MLLTEKWFQHFLTHEVLLGKEIPVVPVAVLAGFDGKLKKPLGVVDDPVIDSCSIQNCASEKESGTTGVCCTRCAENYDNILVTLTVPAFIDLRLNGFALEFVIPVGFVGFPDPGLDAGVDRLTVLMLTIALKAVAVQSTLRLNESRDTTTIFTDNLNSHIKEYKVKKLVDDKNGGTSICCNPPPCLHHNVTTTKV